MTRPGRRVAIVAAVVMLSSIVAGGVIAASRPGDDDALAPTRQPADRGIEAKVNSLLAKMTLDEKLQQLQLLADWQATPDAVKKGVGGVFSQTDPAKINELQQVAVEQTRLHIPILFAFDTIHGFRTVF